MFNYKREANFKISDLKKLEHISENLISSYIELEDKKNSILKDLDKKLKKISKQLYEGKDSYYLKEVVNLRRKIKYGKREITKLETKAIGNHDFWIRNSLSKLRKIEKKIDLDIKKIKGKTSNSEIYDYFFSNLRFKESLAYINPMFYRLLGQNKKNKKTNETKYSYIQRGLLKANSLSGLGLTSFYSYSNKTFKNKECSVSNEKKILNPYVITSLLFLISKDVSMTPYLKFNDLTFSYIGNEKVLFHKRYYTNSSIKSFVIQENMFFDISHIEKVKKLLSSLKIIPNEDEYIFYLNNNLIVPDFTYYLNDERKLIDLLSNSSRWSWLLRRIFEIESDSLKINNKEKEFLKRYDTYYFSESLIEILLNNPLRMNYVSGNFSNFSEQQVINITPEEKKLVNRVVIPNYLYNIYNQELTKILKASEGDQNLLHTILQIEHNIFYSIDFKSKDKIVHKEEDYLDKLNEKNCMIFFQTRRNCEKPLITGIYPGNGYLMGREFPKMREDVLEMYFNRTSKLVNGEIVEVVVDNETSSTINTGYSPFKKLYWPKDFNDVIVKSDAKGIKFFKDNKRIHLRYFGSIPVNMLMGNKAILLNMISPWIINPRSTKLIEEYNSVTTYKLHSEEITASMHKGNSSVYDYIRLLVYFKKNKLPNRFFIRRKTRDGLGKLTVYYI